MEFKDNTMALQNSSEQISLQDSFLVLTPNEELDRIKDLQRERDRINERYNRKYNLSWYRGIVTLLQQQLEFEEARRATKSSRCLRTSSGDARGDGIISRQRNKDAISSSPPTRINHRKRRVAFDDTTGVTTSTPARKSAANSSYLTHQVLYIKTSLKSVVACLQGYNDFHCNGGIEEVEIVQY